MTATELGINDFSVSGSTVELSKIDEAISMVSSFRSSLGAVQNRLEHTINNLAVSEENLQAADPVSVMQIWLLKWLN